MSEISMYDAQKKKMEGLCEEHDLTFRFQKDTYPLIFTIKPTGGIGAQMSMLENVEEVGYRSPDASMTWIFEDGNLQTKVTGGTFTISKTLRTKIENILIKMITYWQQYFFRDVIQRNALKDGMKPEIDESDANDTDVIPAEAEPLEEYEDEVGEGAAEEIDNDADLPDTDDPDEDDGEDADEDPEDDAEDGAGEALGGVSEDMIQQAISIIRMENKASVSLLQRRMNIGYSKAARLIDALEERGVIGPYNGSAPREVLPFDVPDEEVTDNG